SQL
ncbi:hypothetical protein D049_1284B, partial [Vibrio parahaemolyticus VPTS-2010]